MRNDWGNILRKFCLSYRQRTQTKENPFVSYLCKKRFTSGDTQSHHYTAHSREKPFERDICKKCFISFQFISSLNGAILKQKSD